MLFIIPGFLVTIATFPGVIVHEAAHLLFCRWFRLAVFDVCFLRLENPCGYVIHEEPAGFRASFFVAMGPFFVNTVLCILFCSAAFLPVWELDVPAPLPWFFYWLGLSIGMHAFPSTTDLDHVWRRAPEAARRGDVLALATYPLVGLLYVANFLRFFWVDLLYGLAVGILAPLLVFRALV